MTVFNGSTNDQPDKVLTPSGGPAADLFKNKYGLASSYGLVYPKDLYSSGRAHSVVFDIFEVAPVTLNEAISAIANATSSVKDYFSSTPDSSSLNYENELDKQSDAAAYDKLGPIAGKIAQGIDYLSSVGVATAGVLGGGPRTKQNAAASIALYMPETLNFSYDARYNDNASISGAMGSLTGSLGQGMSSFIENTALKLAMNAAGYVFNPQQQVLFEGIDFRPYEMNFTFTPSSAEETRSVNEIIKTFRLHAAPEIGGIGNFFFTPPSIFNVSFKYAGKTNPNINLLKKSVLKNVAVNYAPNGWAAFEGNGAPVQITLGLQFQEIVLVDKTEIRKGY